MTRRPLSPSFSPLAVLAAIALLAFAPFARAQDPELTKLATDFAKSLSIQDTKGIDRAVKTAGEKAVRYYQDIRAGAQGMYKEEMEQRLVALRESFTRLYGKAVVLEKFDRWYESQDQKSYQDFLKIRDTVLKVWLSAADMIKAEPTRESFVKSVDALIEVARQMESTGHKVEAAETWGLVANMAGRMPQKTLEDRRNMCFAVEQFLAGREAWEWTGDTFYGTNKHFLEGEKARIEKDAKAGEKRKEEGYDPKAKGIETLVMPNVPEALHKLAYEPLATWENELDYGPKNGPVPAFWYTVGLGENGKTSQMNWFRRKQIYVARLGAAKFGIALTDDGKHVVEADISGKKPTKFFLDPEKKSPYAMFLWVGGEKERVGDAETNMAPAQENASVYYKSAASWKTAIGPTDTVVLYDDNASGLPCDSDPLVDGYKVHSLGDTADGTPVPLFDSMRVNKGPRVPFSEFVRLSSGWFWLHRPKDRNEDVGVRPMNPEYVKTGKVKLVWAGPKPSAPAQLVIRGSGDYATAMFDVAGGKEIEVPAADYTVLWGKIVNGKGAKAQTATLYASENTSFTVEAGKTFELKMGAPFKLKFTRGGEPNSAEVTIEGTKIFVRESSGCIFTELHAMGMAPEVLAAKAADGKGAQPVGEFSLFTDPELLNKAATKLGQLGLHAACFPMPKGYKDGPLTLTVKLPSPGMKVGLAVKKHSVFGPMTSVFQ